MAEKKRQCGTCRFFVENKANGHGKCTHPKRAGTEAELLLLRPNELACRTKWGDSLWQDPEDDRDPMEPQSPQQPSLPEPIAAQLQFDDEVTSVSIAGGKSSRSSFEDDVVDSGATATGMASWNDPVQDERRDLLRKGSHDALAGARKRHMEKQARQRELIPFAEDDEATQASPKPVHKQEQPKAETEPAAGKTQNFAPADFVEEERAKPGDDSSLDDELIDEGVKPDRHRSPRMRKLLRDANGPKTNEAMRMNVPSEMRVTSHNPENRERWNSVPTLNPGIEIPLTYRIDNPPPSQLKVSAAAAPVASSSYQPRPVSQARELISEDRLRQERAQRQMVAPLIDEEARQPEVINTKPVSDRPRLTEAPARDAAPLEQIKSSPLRGYHPAARKLTQQPERERWPSSSIDAPRRAPQQGVPVRSQDRNVSAPPAAQRMQPTTPSRNSYDASPHQREPDRSVDLPRRQMTQSEREVPQRERQHQRPDEGQHRAERRRPHHDEYRDERPRQSFAPMQTANEPFKREKIEISPTVPRICGTCTSYRPSGIEGRGSCTNGFAGPVQRVVHEQDLACLHTFGSFWIPADEEVWLEELKTDYPPTPRVDAMLARKRRRENTVLPDLDDLTS